MAPPLKRITAARVRADFNDPVAVAHYARASHQLGLWASERILIERWFPDRAASLLEAGCGAGRVTLGLWELGYRRLVAFDFARALLEHARHLAEIRGVPLAGPGSLGLVEADATDPGLGQLLADKAAGPFDGVIFPFNGLMQIPGRTDRRRALRALRGACRPGAPFLFTTHDRDHSPLEQALWRLEAERWRTGRQDPRLREFGDRYFEDEAGRTFMHLPDRGEILEDLAATGWMHAFDSLRREVAAESRAVLDFSDECRFWVARSAPSARNT